MNERLYQKWLPWEDELLKSNPDDEAVAKLLDRNASAVYTRRNRLLRAALAFGKPADCGVFPRRQNEPWEEWEDRSLFENFDDTALVAKLQRSPAAIHNRRSQVGAVRFRRWSEEEKALFLNCSDKEIAKRTGRSLNSIPMQRRRYAPDTVARAFRCWSPEETALLYSDKSAAEIAKLTGRTKNAVQVRRSEIKRAKQSA